MGFDQGFSFAFVLLNLDFRGLENLGLKGQNPEIYIP